MSEPLYHPNLPGRVLGRQPHQVRTARASGWVSWDDLTEEQQAAHDAAVRAGLAESDDTPETSAEETPKRARKSTKAPATGETPKE